MYRKIILLLIPCFLYAQTPNITSISGKADIGATLTLNGANFGTKSTATPVKWDRFENGSNGSTVTGWVLKRGGTDAIYPIYSNTRLRDGSGMSARMSFQGWQYNCGVGLGESEVFETLYVSFWANVDYTTATYPTQIKIWRAYGNSGDHHPATGHTDQVGANWAYIWSQGEADDPSNLWDSFDLVEDTWVRYDFALKMNTPGSSNGLYQAFRDGSMKNNITDAVHRRFDNQWFELQIGHYWASDGTPRLSQGYIYHDDIYIDNSWARVEIGDNSVFANCTHREMQGPTSWSPSQIEITFNPGSFPSKTEVYLFVVNSDGSVSSGKPIVIDSTYIVDPQAPQFVTHPTNKERESGESVTFGPVSVTGNPVPTYQWQRDIGGTGTYVSLVGETSTALTFTTALADSGNYYRCKATNSEGTATSNSALLRVFSTSVPSATMEVTILEAVKTAK